MSSDEDKFVCQKWVAIYRIPIHLYQCPGVKGYRLSAKPVELTMYSHC